MDKSANRATIFFVLVIVLIILLLVFNRFRFNIRPNLPPPLASVSPTLTPPVLGVQTKKENCQMVDSLPDPACTPGSVFSNLTPEQICAPGYTQSARDVPLSVKKQVYQEYNITSPSPGQYEVDHLISLELGGNNDLSNLWPQPCQTSPGCHQKDKVENYLHQQLCLGKIDLATAQHLISTNWLSVYYQIN